MARTELDTIKQGISLLRLIESQGYEINKRGKDYVTRCPFHEDATPSLVITPDKNLFHCFGCDAAGSVIDWVMKTQGVSFKHAVELLRKDIPLAADHQTLTKYNTVPKLAAPLADDADKQTALQQVIAFYHKSLRESTEAQSYLKQRGLDDVELINHFKLGYANRTLGLHLPQRNRQSGAKLRGLLQAIGIYRDSGHEHFNGSLVIPVINDHQVLEVYGRKILGNKLRKGTVQHLYLPGPHQGIFNRDGLLGDELILCESLIDALTFWRWGFKQVTCSYGTNGFTDELLQCLIEKKIKRVLIAYDRDEAGSAAAEKLAVLLNKNNIDAYRILFPKNMDANEYALQGCSSAAGGRTPGAAAQQVTPAQKSLALVIRKAEPIGTIIHTPNNPLAAEAAITELETQATPIPKDQKISIPTEVKNNEIHITLADRLYRIKGFDPKANDGQLKINLMAIRTEASDVQGCTNIAGAGSAGAMHMDKLAPNMEEALKLAKSITSEEIDFISMADYGNDSTQHKEALKKLIFDQGCVVTKDLPWCPYEVIELMRWSCKEGHEREFAICNIIIAISVVAGTDLSNEPQHMLNTIAPEYDKLPENLRELVLNILIKADEKWRC